MKNNKITRAVNSIFAGIEKPAEAGFEPVEAGSYVARCVSLIDLGTQYWDSPQYGKQEKRKVFLTWELPTEMKIFKEENGKEPIVISKEYTLSFSEKANLRKDLESWRGKTFTPDELLIFDEFKILGLPCMLSVINSTKGEKTYANISGVAPMPKGLECPEQIKKTVIFSLNPDETDNIDMETFSKLPGFLQKKIRLSPEFEHFKFKEIPIEI